MREPEARACQKLQALRRTQVRDSQLDLLALLLEVRDLAVLLVDLVRGSDDREPQPHGPDREKDDRCDHPERHPAFFHLVLVATRSLALRARGLRRSSSSSASMGFLPSGSNA